MPHRLGIIAVLSLSLGVLALAQSAGPAQGSAQGSAQGGAPGQRTPARAPATPGEAAPTGTAVIRGSIVALESGAPLRRAQVRVFARELRESRMATTDGLGRFEFRDLPAGRYTVNASKSGFVSLQFGQRRPTQSGTPIEVHDKQILEKVTIGLPRGSVITGRITDEFGEPVALANVMALQSRAMGGTRRWLPIGGPGGRTDDLGQFRLFGLPPGEYVVSATYQMMSMETDTSPEASGFAPTYYPGVPNVADAQRITVAVGEENGSASFPLIATHVVSVEGTVASAQGGPITQGMVMLQPSDAAGQTMMFMGGGYGGPIANTGRFKIANVAPGRYIAQVRAMGQDNGEIGRAAITVGNEKVENVSIVMMPGGRITGRVVTDTGAPMPSDAQKVQIIANPASIGSGSMSGGGPARMSPGGTFELRGLVDPRLIRVFGASGWMLKAVIANGHDYIDTAIDVQPGQTITGMEVVLTNRVNNVSGAVTDERGQPVLDTAILVFPDEPRLWQPPSRYVRTTRPDQQGRYRIEGLPASDAYLVIAVQDYEDGQLSDPEYLATLRGNAMRFSLRDAEAKVVDLRQK